MVTFSSLKPLKQDLNLMQAEEEKLILTRAQSHTYQVQLELEKGVLSAKVFEFYNKTIHELVVEELRLPLARDHHLSCSQAQKLISNSFLKIKPLYSDNVFKDKPSSVIVELIGKLLGGGGGCSKASAIKPDDTNPDDQVHVKAISLQVNQDAKVMNGVYLIEQGVNGNDEDLILQGLALLQRVKARALSNTMKPMLILIEILMSVKGQWISTSIKYEIAEQVSRLSTRQSSVIR